MLKTHYPYHRVQNVYMADREVGSWVVFVGDDVCEDVGLNERRSVRLDGRLVGRVCTDVTLAGCRVGILGVAHVLQ